ncbi:rhomboid family intramembrane serine protease [Spirosoma sp. BT702]|uniref:Rhomboid family intramembrane serine protease n=1 Tax=Spirosoma profusum TaxID=2771354 RepID=A0A927AVX3_9BACT|nr:rhomboid family intramembrane serine protease [Spirosoma profusum]MBD2705392.1 rhomboid family intramembrane serine protease [Spirosoma profusum]
MFNLTPVVRILLIINVLVYMVTNEAIIQQFGLHSFVAAQFNPIQILTHMFLHGGLNHIFSNMIGLIVFGPMLESYWGPKRFTFFYLFTGIGAAFLYGGINYYEMQRVYELYRDEFGGTFAQFATQYDQPMVGASGAIFGVIMGYGLLFPNTQLFLLFPPIPVKAKYLVIFYAAFELYSGVYRAQADNVAHFAHIGGMLFAFILVKYWGSQGKTLY